MTAVRLSILYTIFIVFLYISWLNNWIHYTIDADPTYIVFIIFFGLVASLIYIFVESIMIKKYEFTKEYMELIFSNRIGSLQTVSNSFVALGLLGTVIGFIVGLHGLDPSMLTTIESMSTTVINLMAGMGIAFYTTLVGGIANLVLDFAIGILNQGYTDHYRAKNV